MSKVYYGALVSPLSLTAYLALPHALLCVSERTGEIEWLEDDVHASMLQDILAEHGQVDDVQVVELKAGEFLMPGFVDTHTHAPQLPNIGSGQQHELLDWLTEVTFPMEARFADVEFARRTYVTVVRRIIDCGTTTCCYYGTLHLEATKALAEIVHAHGQRAFVGKCNMDRNCPDYYVEPSADASMAATRELIAHIPDPHTALRDLQHPRAPCGPRRTRRVRSHTAHPDTPRRERGGDRAHALALPSGEPPLPAVAPSCRMARPGTYAGVYDAYGLLRENTVLAHCVHLEEAEVEIIKTRRAGVSHCPTSNFNLRSGCSRIGMLLDHGVKVGLGTDVSGGFAPSILRAVQDASVCSKVVAMQPHFSRPPAAASAPPEHFTNRQLPVAALLHLATLGGAQVCGLDGHVGALSPGRAFDALVVSVRTDAGNLAVWGADMDAALGVGASGGEHGREGGRGKTEKEELEGMLERFLFCGDDRNIRRVYVQGRLIGGKEFRA